MVYTLTLNTAAFSMCSTTSFFVVSFNCLLTSNWSINNNIKLPNLTWQPKSINSLCQPISLYRVDGRSRIKRTINIVYCFFCPIVCYYEHDCSEMSTCIETKQEGDNKVLVKRRRKKYPFWSCWGSTLGINKKLLQYT